jgi:hypothetical protein
MVLSILGIMSFLALGYALYIAAAPEKAAAPSKALIN